VVAASNDESTGQVYVYVGAKKGDGNDVERAGLTGGTLYGIKITGISPDREDDDTVVPPEGAAFELVKLPDVSSVSAARMDVLANRAGVSRMARPEDAVWDLDGSGLYVASTASFGRTSRLWHLTFDDPSDVTAGGVAQVALASPPYVAEAPQGPRMMDNLTVNDRGQVLIQEDTGNQPYVSGIWQYDPATGAARRIAQQDPERFEPGAPGFLTQSEESSGIIPAPFLGRGKYLIASEAHYSHPDPELVQGGQLLVLHVPPGQPVR
jgi:secreted PhoX family phosphatase